MNTFICLFFFTFLISSVISHPFNQETKYTSHYGYESCPTGSNSPNMINVHLVCHSHDDVGWLKTVDQYYYGAFSPIQRAGVQYILDSVIDSLRNDPMKRFIYVETAFFTRWWYEQTDEMKQLVKKLVCAGQLEFIGGGWSMNDEAGSHYNAIIDQMTWGLRFLNDTFGKCGRPKVAWQIDPFGHSKEQASLFAQMYFDGLFFGRLDWQDKNERLVTKTMEHIWKANPVLGTYSDLFTGALRNGYDPPAGFCFDIMCNDAPIMDDPKLKNYNVDDRVARFIELAESQASFYATNHIVMTMGSDFHYQYAGAWFKNLDKLILHTNKMQQNGSNVNIFYSTPSCYLYALNKANRNWTVKFDDYFPYSSDPHAFWTGYFTSRPSFKRYEKMGNNYMQACKQLVARSKLEDKVLDQMRDAMGVMQHHDAITGTAKQHVTNDYYETLASGVKSCQDAITGSYEKLLPLTSASKVPQQVFCDYLNISACEITEQSVPIAVTVYNPLAWNVSTYIRLPVVEKLYKVMDPTGKAIDIQIVPIANYIINIPGRKSKATAELVFKVELPPLGHSTYIVQNTSGIFYSQVLEEQKSHVYNIPTGNETIIMKNKFLSVTIGKSGLLESIELADGTKMAVNQSFYYYKGMTGNNQTPEKRASGAYIFRPNGTEPFPVGQNISIAFVNGSLVQELHQVFSPWVGQTIRLYHDQEDVKLSWVVGPIPAEDEVGREVITRFDTDLQNDNHFYTDANGRQMVERIWDFRPTWKVNLSEPIAGNYYPVNSRIFIRDKKTGRQFTVLNDRSQGGSSTKPGSVELMLHRRLLEDDAFGVDEALNETAYGEGLVVTGSTYLIFSKMDNAASKHRPLGQKIYLQPLLSFAVINTSDASYMQNFKMQSSGLKSPIPENVHLLTLEPWKNGSLLIRLEHMYEFNEDPNLSKSVKVDLKNRFTEFDILSLRETTLSANQYSDEAKRLHWNTEFSYHIQEDAAPVGETGHQDAEVKELIIPLSPLRIRTFIAEVKYLR